MEPLVQCQVSQVSMRLARVTNYRLFVLGKSLSCGESTQTRDKSNRRTECGAAFHRGKTHYSPGECTEDFNCIKIMTMGLPLWSFQVAKTPRSQGRSRSSVPGGN